MSLKLLVALNVLFFLSFLIVALLAAGRAHAQTPACSGADMLSALQKDNPDTYRKIETEAAATPNGKGLLWKLEKAGERPSFLFGTMHMTDPRVTTLPPAAQTAYDAADTIIIETTEVLDKQKMMAAMLNEPDLMMFTDNTTLSSLLSPDDAAVVNKALDARGIPPGSVSKMKPWLLSAMVALPVCEVARQAGGTPVLDVKLAQDAMASGKTVEGLETVAGQLRAMASLPLAFHMKGLVDTLKLGDRINDVNETMIVLYLTRRHRHVLAAVPRDPARRWRRRGGLRGLRSNHDHQPQPGDGRSCRADPRSRQRLHGGRRHAPSGRARPGRGFSQGGLHRHRRR